MLSRPTIRNVGLATAVSTIASFPVMFVGGLAVYLQTDLSFDAAELGIAVAVHFASAAVAAGPAGLLAERIGPVATCRLGIMSSIAALFGIALAAHAWVSLVFLMSLAGVGISITQLGANIMLVRGVAVDRRGLAFGVAQAAFPLAALLAGLSVPAISVTLGWRSTFVLGAFMGLLVLAVSPAGIRPVRSVRRSLESGTPLGSLLLLALGMALASAGGTSSAAFTVSSSVDRGLSQADAALVLAVGGMVGVSVRIVAGWIGDRSVSRSLPLVISFVMIGAVGYVGLALSHEPALIVLSTAVSFGGGWGWIGVWLLFVSRAASARPGAAMGVIYIGGMTGAVIGPLVFGAMAHHVNYSASWLTMAVMALAGAGAMLLTHSRTLTRQQEPARRR